MKFIPRRTALAAMGAVAALAVTGTAMAQTVTLRLHQMLPQQATIPAKAIVPWAQKVEAESGGKIKVQIFNAMQLGGAPPQLFDQARDGVVDITWTVLGYTPGRFPKTEVFELPFMSSSAESSSKALQEYVEKFAADEFKDVKLIAVHTHGPGLFHTKQPVSGLESLRGMKIRGGSRIINNMLTKLGATPVGMPVPAVTDALSKGTIDGTTIPWEVTPSLKVTELVKNHTTFAGKEGLYTQTFAFSMNKASYEKLPPDLKKVLDANSGADFSAFMGKTQAAADVPGKAQMLASGSQISVIPGPELDKWRKATDALDDQWAADITSKGGDGKKLLQEARDLIKKYTK